MIQCTFSICHIRPISVLSAGLHFLLMHLQISLFCVSVPLFIFLLFRIPFLPHCLPIFLFQLFLSQNSIFVSLSARFPIQILARLESHFPSFYLLDFLFQIFIILISISSSARFPIPIHLKFLLFLICLSFYSKLPKIHFPSHRLPDSLLQFAQYPFSVSSANFTVPIHLNSFCVSSAYLSIPNYLKSLFHLIVYQIHDSNSLKIPSLFNLLPYSLFQFFLSQNFMFRPIICQFPFFLSSTKTNIPSPQEKGDNDGATLVHGCLSPDDLSCPRRRHRPWGRPSARGVQCGSSEG